MNRTARSLLLALLGVALWLGWVAEHEHTSIRAPWTGLTLVASGLLFIASGVVGRGWRALLGVAVAVAAGAVLRELVIYSEVEVPSWLFVLILTIMAALLAGIGIALRRAFWFFRHGSEVDDPR
ncbi:MAG: hypothetical protein M3N47_04450 [Chloroflexota bacterium]|nr:hypothetical protein [Chloroflexota bacterium]